MNKKKILQVQKLLHEDYQDVDVVIYRSRLLFVVSKLWAGWKMSEIQELLLKKANGWYDTVERTVHIPLFSFDKGEFLSVEVIFTLFHELRHHYQNTRDPKLFKQRDWSIPVTDNEYNNDPTERDANKFAVKMLYRHREEISEIFEVENNWEVRGNAPT